MTRCLAVRLDPELSQGPWAANATKLGLRSSDAGAERSAAGRICPIARNRLRTGRNDVIAWRELIRRNGLEAGLEEYDDQQLGADSKQRRASVLSDREEFGFSVRNGYYLRKDDVQPWLR